MKSKNTLSQFRGRLGRRMKNRWSRKETNVQHGSLNPSHTDGYIKARWSNAPETAGLDQKAITVICCLQEARVMPRFVNVTCVTIWGKVAVVVFVWAGWL